MSVETEADELELSIVMPWVSMRIFEPAASNSTAPPDSWVRTPLPPPWVSKRCSSNAVHPPAEAAAWLATRCQSCCCVSPTTTAAMRSAHLDY